MSNHVDLQYVELLKDIIHTGVPKSDRTGTGILDVFGRQMRFDLRKGFPLLTTKKVAFKSIKHELLWFLKGDTNIKYLVDNGVNIWNANAYDYYLKICNSKEYEEFCFRSNTDDCYSILKYVGHPEGLAIAPHFCELTFDEFIQQIQTLSKDKLPTFKNYTLGDCGYQYGKVWRKWETQKESMTKNGKTYPNGEFMYDYGYESIDQIKNVIDNIIKDPLSRRHIVTAIDPTHDKQLALYWCHALFQFNCEPIHHVERIHIYNERFGDIKSSINAMTPHEEATKVMDEAGCPKYYLDCQLYQRSCDMFLGVPFNIASYALLTSMIAVVTNTVERELVWTGGSCHIYNDHKQQVLEQIQRTPKELPILVINRNIKSIDEFTEFDLAIGGYDPHSPIKAKMSV